MSTPTGRVAGLDVLRGIAIALVMLKHASPTFFPGAGVVGVVMFFALSGYLITGLLVGEIERTGTVDLRGFYVRRAHRLVPALVALVAGIVVVTLAVDPLDDRAQLGKTVLVALTWTGNLPFGHASDATFHLWTLATEEQFYLFWPAVLALAVARQKVGATLVLATAACTAGCVATVVWLREAPDLAYALPTSWALCFVVGAATRILQHRMRVPSLMALPVLAALGVLSVVPLRGHALTYLAGGPAIAALTAVLLISWRTWNTVSTRPLRALAWLGTVSYGAYLWNYPLTLWLRPSWGEVAGPAAMVLTVVAAAASWHLVEHPLQHQRAPEPATP
ncbi:acyltransferase family protein [Nocardioides zhouii]|uniref:Acyltransferase n=1 Tax=Nocardioides zhouii TaxID=1168729 RepID=A0A4Q2SK23_9ACTN|nr:acyltransferase [Nocardioides zhouii]RYC05782.1 acyltransferase [Nocardioides zhouii]